MPSLGTIKLVGMLLGAAAVIGFIMLANHWRSEKDALQAWQKQVVNSMQLATGEKFKPADIPDAITSLGSTIADVRAKTLEAQEQDAAAAKAKENEFAQAGKVASDDYQRQIAAADARYAALVRQRSSQTTTHSGGSGTATMPDIASNAQGASNTTCQNELPPADALIATHQAIQLKSILDWGAKVGIIR